MGSANLAYTEESWDELIGGKVVAMSPRPVPNHNRVTGNIYRIFSSYLLGRKCEYFSDGVDVYLSGFDRFVPDGMVVCDPDKVKNDGVYGAPDLVVEVLSPTTARYDRGHKKAVYAKCGVKEYWLVNPADKTLEQYVQKDGSLELRDVYVIPPDYLAAKMTPEEQAELVKTFQCTLFDDLDISLEDVFQRVT